MYYRIITSEGLNQRIENNILYENVNSLIQLSERYLKGYKQVIEDELPSEKDGFSIVSNYEIIDGKVHLTHHYEPIKTEENADTDITE